ncbi:MAG: DUF167 domain-containing protein [bacterium]
MKRKIIVKVKPNAKMEKVEQVGEILEVWVKEPARENKANEAVLSALARHLRIPRNRVNILRGHHSRKKIIEVDLG